MKSQNQKILAHLLPRKKILKMYEIDKKSINDIASEFCVSYSRARTALIAFGAKIRSRADGVRAAAHKLGLHSKGRKRIFTKRWRENIRLGKIKHGDLFAKGTSAKKSGYVVFTKGDNKGRGVHTVMIENIIGRKLRKGEVVHHIDGDKGNNVKNNLMLMTRGAHTSLHRRLGNNG